MHRFQNSKPNLSILHAYDNYQPQVLCPSSKSKMIFECKLARHMREPLRSLRWIFVWRRIWGNAASMHFMFGVKPTVCLPFILSTALRFANRGTVVGVVDGMATCASEYLNMCLYSSFMIHWLPRQVWCVSTEIVRRKAWPRRMPGVFFNWPLICITQFR